MTIAADAFARRDSAAFARWTACMLIVLALHGAAFLLIVRHRVPFEPVGLPPAAVIIDLAPAPPAAPPEVLPPPEPIPPQPEQLAPHEPEPVIPEVETSPAPHPEVVLPRPQPPRPKPKAKPVERPPVQQPIAPVPAAPAPVAPAAPAPAPSTANVRATWQAQLLSWLERHKRYPRVAQEQRQQGVARLRFALDRQGRVLSFRLDQSSGFTLLDEEVLELIQRAQPVPAPPPEIPGDRIEVLVPVAFSLHRGRS